MLLFVVRLVDQLVLPKPKPQHRQASRQKVTPHAEAVASAHIFLSRLDRVFVWFGSIEPNVATIMTNGRWTVERQQLSS